MDTRRISNNFRLRKRDVIEQSIQLDKYTNLHHAMASMDSFGLHCSFANKEIVDGNDTIESYEKILSFVSDCVMSHSGFELNSRGQISETNKVGLSIDEIEEVLYILQKINRHEFLLLEIDFHDIVEYNSHVEFINYLYDKLKEFL